MADNEMSWDEAETVAREMVSQLQAADKIHQACLKVRHAYEEVNRLRSEAATHSFTLDEVNRQMSEAHTKAAEAEAASAARIMAAQQQADLVEAQVGEAIGAHQERLKAIQQAVTVAHQDHKTALAFMEREAKAKAAQLIADHQALLAKHEEEAAVAKARRDEAQALLRKYLQTVSA
jgi:hypothetical protein